MSKPINSTSSHSLPGAEDITRIELPNGIVLLIRSNFNSLSVVLDGLIEVGSLFDSDDKLGLADFTAQALLRGTQRYDFHEIYEALETVGAHLSFDAGAHLTNFAGRALTEDLPLLLRLSAEALCRPCFPDDEVERLRAQILAGLAIRDQDTEAVASMAFDALVYGSHPYSRPDEGYQETVQAIQPADLVNFHMEHYGPRGMILAIVGAVEPQQAVELAAQAFGNWQNPTQPDIPPLPALQPLEKMQTKTVKLDGKSQADLVLGAPGPSRYAEDFMAAALGNNILGQFGMMGRIGQVVREQAGLAYYAYSSLSAGTGPGPWYISAGVDPENITAAITMIEQEIHTFTDQLVEEEELADSQAQFIGSLPLSFESNAGVAAGLVWLERYHLGLDYYRRYPSLIQAITREQVLQAARHYLDPERLGLAIAGP